jgi:DNA-binding CsgD family transcriptional regulator/PAS domain-containing protein
MNSRDVVLALVQDLLAAPGSQRGWEDFLLHLCDALGGSGANLISYNFAAGQGSVSATAKSPVEAVALYREHWHEFDPWAHSPATARLTPGAVVIGDQLIDRSEFERTPFHNEFGRHFGVIQVIAGTIEASADTVSVVSVNGTKHRRPFDAEDSALLGAVMPSFQRALQIHRRLTGAELMAANASAILDRFPHGIILVSANGAVVATNRAADEMLRARDGVTLDHGELRASTVDVTNRLRSALHAAVGTHQGINVADGKWGLALPRPSGRRPLSIIIAPMPARRAALTSDGGAAAIFITDPDRAAVPDPALLRCMFDLTIAESELVRILLAGLSLDEAAVQLGVRLDTVRKRLKLIFQKTDTHRQADLVRLVLNSTASL